MFRIGVCDDEAYFREDLEKRLTVYFKDKPLEPEILFFEKGQALLDEAEQSPFDLVFLDIEMPDMKGVMVGEKLREMDNAVFLIFVTSHHKFISQAMQLGIFQYLIKPVEDTFFEEEINRMITQYMFRKREYTATYKGVRQNIPISEIIYLESRYWNVVIHTKDKEYISVRKLGEEEKRLLPYGFVRIHQSYLVNMACITRFLSDKVFLKGLDEPLPVSRKYKEAAKKAHLSYQSEKTI